MRIEIFSEFSDLKDSWNDIVLEAKYPEVSLTFEWNYAIAMANNLKNSVKIIVLYDNDEIVGICPIFVSKTKRHHVPSTQIGPVTNIFSAHNNLICSINKLDFLNILLKYFQSNINNWTYFSITGITESSSLLSTLKKLNKYQKYPIKVEPNDCSPFLPIERAWDEFMKGKSSNFRQQLKRKQNRIYKSGDIVLRKFEKLDDVNLLWEAVKKIEKNSWKAENGSAIINSQNQINFYKKLLELSAEQGWLFCHILYIDKTPIAHDLGLLFSNKYYQLKNSFDKRYQEFSPGIVLRSIIMKLLFEMNVSECDFMWGEDSWKKLWTQNVRHHHNIIIYNYLPFKSKILRIFDNI